MAGTYLVIALAAGRYVAVNKPHLAQIWNTRERQRTIVVVVFIVTFFIAMVSFLWQTLREHRPHVSYLTPSTQPGHTAFSNQSQGTRFKATTTVDPYSWGLSTELPATGTSPSTTGSQEPFKDTLRLFYFTFHFAVPICYLYLIPLPCLVVINIGFLRGLRRFQKRRKRFAQTQTDFTSSNQVRVVLNVAVILAVFLVCQATSLAMWIMCAYRGIKHQEYDSYERRMPAKISFFFTALNCAVNFWVYLAFLKDFRLAMARMVARVCHCCSCTQEN